MIFVFLYLTSLSMISRSIHVAAYGIYIHLLMVYIYIFFIHSSVHGRLGCFHVLAIVNSAALNFGCVYLFELRFSQGICPGVGLLDHMVVLFLVF